MRSEALIRPWRAVLAHAVREPLVQFLVIALALFAIDGVVRGPSGRTADGRIAISQGRVMQLAESYRLLSGRMPSRTELQGLVNDYIDEEVGYREAIALGLDADDTIVRRRMRQKLEFLAEDTDVSEEPSDEQLANWFATHQRDYRMPSRVALAQVLASADTRGARAEADAASFLPDLRAGSDPASVGDATMLPAALPLSTRESIAAQFGEAFAASVFAHVGYDWFGPVTSPFGAHAVQIAAREPGRDLAFDEVRERLRSDWIEAHRAAARARYSARLRERYEVSVDWPAPYAEQTSRPDVPAMRRARDASEAE
jgi:hypothetical protein